MPFRWPDGFPRVPDEDWTRQPVDELALGYDAVGKHGWYANLDPTVEELAALLKPGSVLLDYSGGTGLLIRRLLHTVADRPIGVVDVDSSPKFLRLALERLRDEKRVAFRLIRWLKEARRLQYVDEALEPALLGRGVDAVVSANAIHLYYDLDETLRSWARVLRPGGHCLVQSGNVRHEGSEGVGGDASGGEDGSGWIIDDTVHAIHAEAQAIVREDPAFAAYREALDDAPRMARHDALRAKFFLPARPLSFYVDALARAGLPPVHVRTRRVPVRVDEWLDFLGVYHEGILGWVGGSERVEGVAPKEADVAARRRLMRLALGRVLHGASSFDATWTYVTCRKA